MNVYYVFMESIPLSNNEESKEFAGAFVNCWVYTKDENSARNKAINYVKNQGWKVINIEDIFISDSEMYDDEPDSLECFNQAIESGVGATFYIWSHVGEDD